MKNKPYWAKAIVYMVLLLIFLSLPSLLDDYYLTVIGMALIYVSLGLSLNIITGITGRISLCHGAFYGIGAYACGLLIVKTGMAFWPALIVGSFITGVVAFVVGIPFVRTKGPYFAIGTLCFGVIVSIVILNWVSLTGGVSLRGIAGPPGIGFLTFRNMETYYYLILAMVLIYIFINHVILNSRLGRALIAIREDETLASCIAVNTTNYKLFAFTFSGFLAAMAGALYAGYMGAIDPGIAGNQHSFVILIMLVVGGAGTISGAIIGPMLLWILPEYLIFADEWRLFIFGVILLLIIIFMPQGIAGQLRTISPAIARWFP